MAEIVIFAYLKADNTDIILQSGFYNGKPLSQTQKARLRQKKITDRGIKADKNGSPYVDCKVLSDYLLTRLVPFRVKDTVFLYNVKSHLYQPVDHITLQGIVLAVLSEVDESYYSTATAEYAISLMLPKMKSFDEYPEKKNVCVLQNGTYMLNKQKFVRRYGSKHYNTSVLPYMYDEQADCPKFKDFLEDVFNHDNELICMVQEIFGLCFWNDVPIHKLFVWYGRGRNGKSVLVKVLTELVGEENVSSQPIETIQERFALGSLVDKSVNIATEVSQSRLLDTSLLKALTSGDKVQVEKKYKNSVSAKLTCKFIVCSNYALLIKDNSKAFVERYVVIPFENTYVEKKKGYQLRSNERFQIKNLDKQLCRELSGIFNWAMEGLKRLRKNDWIMTSSNKAEAVKERFLKESNPVRLFFASCIEKKEGRILCSQVHRCFQTWAMKNHIRIDLYSNPNQFRNEFMQLMEENHISSVTKRVRGNENYYGIAVADDYISKVNYS